MRTGPGSASPRSASPICTSASPQQASSTTPGSSDMDYETHEHDVIVIGAGGAGLRAAIESSELGASTAVICKSLLGKAHTVMAEGGVAAALGNVDEADGWETHFQDTLSAGKYLNNWRMAE